MEGYGMAGGYKWLVVEEVKLEKRGLVGGARGELTNKPKKINLLKSCTPILCWFCATINPQYWCNDIKW